MFIGEMGCWLVVGCFALYNRFTRRQAAPLLQGGYTSLNDEQDSGPENSEDEEETDVVNNAAMSHSFSSLEAHNPTVKTLLPSTTAASTSGRLELKGWRIILLALPACCDITGTTLMNVGLLFVAASIYQMTRGALVLFVGLFSVFFLIIVSGSEFRR